MEAEYGAPRATGTWGAGYTYGSVEQDVSPSAFVFSDMPGTNVRLHMIKASYILKTGFSLDATLSSDAAVVSAGADSAEPLAVPPAPGRGRAILSSTWI